MCESNRRFRWISYYAFRYGCWGPRYQLIFLEIFFAEYLNIVYLPGTEELLIICGTIIGAGIGFLWFNTYPAQIFMGDVGSLSLGAALGGMAVILDKK